MIIQDVTSLTERVGRLVRGIALCASVLLLTACATTGPPVQEMSDARQAINAARALGEELAQPAALVEAERLIEQASQALSEGQYREARTAAVAAKRRAMHAREPAPALFEGH